MEGPTRELRERLMGRFRELESAGIPEEDLEEVLRQIADAMRGDVSTEPPAEMNLQEANDMLASLSAWLSLASEAVAHFYAPSSPWRDRLAGWGKGVANWLNVIAGLVGPALQAAASKLGATGYSIGAQFPWGFSVALNLDFS